jgi:hypothetical protein
MATNPAQPPLDPNPPQPTDERFDELSGVYGFFRRHQKKLLYTAGLFTLLTFSITGPMMDLMRELFGARQALSTIAVGGKRVELQLQDYAIGTKLANSAGAAIPWGVLPPLDAGDGGRTELGDVLAILRRAAIEEGIEVSMVEVDRAIEALREERKVESAVRLATNMSFESLAQFRETMAEALRIGTYIRLQTLAVDSTEAQVLAQVTRDREKITLRTATFDEKKLEEQLKAATQLSDDDLKKWLEAKTDREKMQLQIYDLPRAELRFCGLLLADGQFDPEQWKDDYLKDFTVAEDQLQGYYEQEKARFKLENGEFKPFDDATVKAELTRIVQAEQVMNRLLAAVREQQTAALKPANDALASAQAEKAQAESTLRDLEQQLANKKVEVAAKEVEAQAKPDDAALAAAVAALKAEQEKLANDVFAQQGVPAAKEALVKEAQTALETARAGFDLNVAFADLTKDKKGGVQKAMSGVKNADELKDLDAAGLELGTWAQSATGTSLQNKGDLAFGPARTSKAVLLYQATAVDTKPLKTWDKLKPLLEGAYWTEQAKKQGEEKKKLMEETLLRLAKEKMPEKIAEIEAKRQSRIDEKVATWEKQTQDGIAEADSVLAKTGLGQQATAAWTRKRDTLKSELGMKAQRITEFTAEVGKLIDGEIAEEAKKHYHTVLDAAAAEAGFTMSDVGPFARDLSKQPRFDKAYDPTVVYLFRNQSELKIDEATGVMQDFANRRWYVAACTKVEPLGIADVTRREFEALRTGSGRSSYADLQAFQLYSQGFTREALEQRYDLRRPVGEQREPAPAGDQPK